MKPEERKNLIAILLLSIAILVCNYMLYSRNIVDEIRRLKTEIESIENKKSATLALLRKVKQLKTKRKALREEINRLKKLLPKGEDLPGLIRAISTLAQMSGIDLSRVEMGKEIIYPEKHYAAINIKVSFTSTYPQLLQFLERIDSLDRLVKPQKLKVSTKQISENPKLSVSGFLQTYRYIEVVKKRGKAK